MSYYRIVYRIGGKERYLTEEAKNKMDAIDLFDKRELGVMRSITEVSTPMKVRIKKLNEQFEKAFKTKKINKDSLIATLRQIGIMLDAGISIDTAFLEAIKFTDDAVLRKILESILYGIQGGRGLSESAEPFSEQIGFLTIAMFRLGEQSGTLSESLMRLSNILEQIEDNRRMLKKATRYPVIVIIAMVIAFVVVIMMVIPQFQAMFLESGVELPFPTRLLLWVEHAAERFGPYILVGAMLLAGIFSWMYKKYTSVRLKTDKFILNIYIVGIITRYAMLGRFIYIFQVLMHAGIPVTEALDTSVSVVDNLYIRERLTLIRYEIEEGHPLHSGFKQSDMFEPIAVQMVKTGEDGGAIDLLLGKLSKYYQDRYQYNVDNVATMIEPLLIAAIAGFVLILALGIFLPMWNMATTVGM